jgi:uncharacterized protein
VSGEAPPAGPTPAADRLDVIDVLRGFALAGVLVVNFAEIPKAVGGVNRVTYGLIELFVAGSFYPLFAMLFGVGFVLQFARWEARRAPAIRLYIRRVAGLFLFGLGIWCLLHTWWTLLQYAVTALTLLPFRRARPRMLLLSAAMFIALVPIVAPAIQNTAAAPDPVERRANDQRVNQLKRTGPYSSLVAARARLIVPFLTTPRWYLGPGLSSLGLFLIGAAIARSRVLEHSNQYRLQLRRLVFWGALLGVTTNLIVLWRAGAGVEGVGVLGRLVDAGLDLGDTALALAYGAAVVLAYGAGGAWRCRFAILAFAGRTALTNVVLQWIVISTLLFGYGFGLLDRIGTLTCLLLSIPIFAGELWLSRWWLARRRFGPLEWLWRTMTYGFLGAATIPRSSPGPSGADTERCGR